MKKADGAWGERYAARYLRRKGCRIEARNFRCRTGEVDIIAEKDGFLIFAEVKLRSRDDFGLPREFVTAAKQRRVRSAALQWLAKTQTELQPRFDVLEIYPSNSVWKRAKVIWLEDAFS